MSKPSVLITGCSDGSLGAALALELHSKGFRVFATARNPSKLSDSKAAGIEIITLDVLSETSIANAVAEVRKLTGGSLDMLINNAGATLAAPLADLHIPDARNLFELNVWANIATIQAFLPLLLRSTHGAKIVNHTSISSLANPPFMGIYGASKAAFAMLTVGLRSELSPFGIKVVELKSGAAKSNITTTETAVRRIPRNSLYYAAREWLDIFMSAEPFMKDAMPAATWAKHVAAAISKKNPPATVWVGTNTWLAWIATFLPTGLQESVGGSFAKMDLVTKQINEYGREKAIKDAYGDA